MSVLSKIVLGCGILGLILIVALFYSVSALQKENMELKDTILAWRESYALVVRSQQESEAENKKLREELEQLQTSMSDWKARYDSIHKGLTQSQEHVIRLKKENESIREFLDSSVPLDLWRVFFPEQGTGGNDSDKDGKD